MLDRVRVLVSSCGCIGAADVTDEVPGFCRTIEDAREDVRDGFTESTMDLEEFRACQTGYQGASTLWNDLSRGAKQWVEGADENALAMGMQPQLSGVKTEDEGLYVAQHTYWLEQIRKAAEAEAKNA